MGSRCFFIGHRDTPDSAYPYLLDAVEAHIVRYGVTKFLVGGYGHFDAMAARAVREKKQRYPEVRLIKLLAYYDPLRPPYDVNDFDGSLYPDGLETAPRRAAIVRANRYAVDNSQFMIAYVRHFGNSRDIYEYATQKMPVLNLADINQ